MEKDFKTIVLRNMDSRGMEETVKIMNDVMKNEGIKTAQSVIPFIITDYARLKRLNEDQRQRHRAIQDNLETEISKLNNQLQKVNKALYHFQQFQLLMQEI
jgi:hypothetical protein